MAEEYKTVEFPLNQWVYVKFRFSKPKTGEGEYGTWHLWGVDEWVQATEQWEQASFFAPPTLQALLDTLHIVKGKEIAIMKKAEENQETKKIYTCFDVVSNGEKFTTKKEEGEQIKSNGKPQKPPALIGTETPKIEPSKEQMKTSSPVITPPFKPPPTSQIHWQKIAHSIWDIALAWVSPTPEDQTIETKLKIVEICSPMVNTVIMGNGKVVFDPIVESPPKTSNGQDRTESEIADLFALAQEKEVHPTKLQNHCKKHFKDADGKPIVNLKKLTVEQFSETIKWLGSGGKPDDQS